eukprot:4980629-Pyramimonas_sp.AAC.3
MYTCVRTGLRELHCVALRCAQATTVVAVEGDDRGRGAVTIKAGGGDSTSPITTPPRRNQSTPHARRHYVYVHTAASR